MGPEDLHEVRFERELGGYCPEEVDGFLEQVVFAWRTGSGPDGLLALVRERHFSIAVRGYRRVEVDRVMEEITADWGRARSGLSSPRPTPQASVAESPQQRGIDLPQEAAVSHLSGVREHPHRPAWPGDRFAVPDLNDQPAVALPAEPLPAGMHFAAQTTPIDVADHGTALSSDEHVHHDHAESPRTAEVPLGETVERARDARLVGPSQAIDEAGEPTTPEPTPLAEPSSPFLTEESASAGTFAEPVFSGPPESPPASGDAELPDRDPNERAEQAERLFRLAEGTRLHLISILDQAAHDLAHPTTSLTTGHTAHSIPTRRNHNEPEHPQKQRQTTSQKPKKKQRKKRKAH